MPRSLHLCLASLLLACLTASALAQSSTARTPTSVPGMVKFSGTVQSASRPLVGITFALYKDQQGGAPLWLETQSVSVDATGHYTVQLGATLLNGLPKEVFASGEARWLGAQPEGQTEPPRVLLLSVPYALKAADAETLGGLPLSAFVLSTPSAATAASVASSTVAPSAPPANPTVTGKGTINSIPLWDTASDIVNSALSQSGTGATAKIGINTGTPATTLDVKGAGTIRGALILPATAAATSAGGTTSQPINLTASAFNSGTKNALNQTFRLETEPAANNTATPSGKLNLLFYSGTNPALETGLSIASNGKITFAAGQTFPGAGTITGVTSGAGLTGGGTSGSVTLKIDTTKVPQLSAANIFTANQSVHGNLSATGSVSAATFSGNGAALTNVNAALLSGIPSSSFAVTTADNTFPAGQVFNGNGRQMVLGDPGCGVGYAAIGFSAFSGCSNYALASDGTNMFLNRPSGGALYLREANTNEMTIASGGAVTINQLGGSPIAGLTVNVTEGSYGIEALGGGGATEFATAGSGVLAMGGAETNTSTIGGDGLDAYGGAADQGGIGIYAQGGSSRFTGGGDGIDATAGTGSLGSGYSGFFQGGSLNVLGDLGVSGQIFAGTKDFRIDHPLDPANKYLYHASVESSEMMNIYAGNVTLGPSGAATVQLPDWFEAVNTDFRYQLTAIGAAAPNLHIAEEVANHQFSIAGGAPGMKVSWQVTGVRHDPFAQANQLVVEAEKPANERGFYLHPALYGQPQEKQIEWGRFPAKMRHLQEARTVAQKKSVARKLK
jgi:trimeric autotransporter adhesin